MHDEHYCVVAHRCKLLVDDSKAVTHSPDSARPAAHSPRSRATKHVILTYSIAGATRMSKCRNAALPFLALLMCSRSDRHAPYANRYSVPRGDPAIEHH